MTIEFVPLPESEAATDERGFRSGHRPSLLVNGVTFKIKGWHLGNYKITNDDGSKSDTKYASTCVSILLIADIDGAEEEVSLSRLLTKRHLLYDKDGKAFTVPSCTFQAQLNDFMEKEIGRRADNPAMFKGTAAKVAAQVLKFFEGKTIQCQEVEGFTRDKTNRLVAPLSPCIKFSFYEG